MTPPLSESVSDPWNLADEFQLMLDELESTGLEVMLVPPKEPTHENHFVRVAVNTNPPWYRELCSRHVRPRPYKLRTYVKRQHILQLLRRLAKGEWPDSKYTPELTSVAEKRLEFKVDNEPF